MFKVELQNGVMVAVRFWHGEWNKSHTRKKKADVVTHCELKVGTKDTSPKDWKIVSKGMAKRSKDDRLSLKTIGKDFALKNAFLNLLRSNSTNLTNKDWRTMRAGLINWYTQTGQMDKYLNQLHIALENTERNLRKTECMSWDESLD
jgi:hypothetical protein